MIRLFFALLSFALLSCGAKGTKETGNMPEDQKTTDHFSCSRFQRRQRLRLCTNQVAFGPRVPNTAAHKACGDYLASEFEAFGAKSLPTGSDTNRLRRNEAGSEKHHRLV